MIIKALNSVIYTVNDFHRGLKVLKSLLIVWLFIFSHVFVSVGLFDDDLDSYGR